MTSLTVPDHIDPILAAAIDEPRFRDWMQTHVEGFAEGDYAIRRLAGGASNLTMLITQGQRRWVMRRPPIGPYPPSAHDMGREFRFYHSMQGTSVPVPRTCGLCNDPAVLGAPFYVMAHVDGRIVATKGDAQNIDERGRWKLCEALARTLADIHLVDIDAAGLGSVARRDSYVARQIKRWTGQWESFDPSENPTIGELSRRLQIAMPDSPPASVVHGDYRIGNVMFAPDGSDRVVAVLDWELATLGDPLADLGYSLIFWGSANPSLEGSVAIPDLPGFMTETELIDAYERAGGARADNIDYYKVLGWFKLAAMSQSHIVRDKQSGGHQAERMIRHRNNLAAIALETADRSHIPGLNGR